MEENEKGIESPSVITEIPGRPRTWCILSAFLGLLSTILAGLLIHTTFYNRLFVMHKYTLRQSSNLVNFSSAGRLHAVYGATNRVKSNQIVQITIGEPRITVSKLKILFMEFLISLKSPNIKWHKWGSHWKFRLSYKKETLPRQFNSPKYFCRKKPRKKWKIMLRSLLLNKGRNFGLRSKGFGPRQKCFIGLSPRKVEL